LILTQKNIQVWEEIDLDRFTELNNCYYSTAVGIVSVFEIGDDNSFERAKNSIIRFKEEKEKLFENFYGLLIGTKGISNDEYHIHQVDAAKDWSKQVGVKDCVDLSSNDLEKVYDITLNLINSIISDLNRVNTI